MKRLLGGLFCCLILLSLPCRAQVHFVKNLGPNSTIYNIIPKTATANNLLFCRSNANEIWVSGGNTGNTTVLFSKQDEYEFDNSCFMKEYGSKLLFTVFHNKTLELWRTDGTREGTQKVITLSDKQSANVNIEVQEALTIYNGIFYFSGPSNDKGTVLWRSDGTDTGTYILKDINPTKTGWGIYGMLVCGNYLYFGADDGTHGIELWKTDGSEKGTVMVKDINPGKGSGFYLEGNTPNFIDFYGRALFAAYDSAHGIELWISDGTAAGTHIYADLLPGRGSGKPQHFKWAYGAAFFESGGNLCRADWTDTAKLVITNKKLYIKPAQVIGQYLYFPYDDGEHGIEIWRIHRDASVPEYLVKDVWPGPMSSISNGWNIPRMWSGGNCIFLSADDGTHGEELWFSDGTSTNTFMAGDVHPGAAHTQFSCVTPYKNEVFFLVQNALDETELWKYSTSVGISQTETQSGYALLKEADNIILKSENTKGLPPTYRLTDISGRQITGGNIPGGSHQFQINTESLPQGVYLITLTDGTTFKFNR